jgi:hypothetical protein
MAAVSWRGWAERVRRQAGAPLPRPQRAFFERGFGCSLEPIRLHVDRDAAEALGAEAFAVGRHIVLREPLRDWDAPATRYLLAHEIAHCVQQRLVGDAAPAAAVGAADDPLEREAHRAAGAILAGRRAAPLSREGRAVVRRQVKVGLNGLFTTQQPAGTKAGLWHNDDAHKVTMGFTGNGIIALGIADLQGDKDGELAGYTLGWIQCGLMETRWAIYRGLNKNDGSTLLDRGWKHGMPVCRDTKSDTAILYDEVTDEGRPFTIDAPGGTKRFPLAVDFQDWPQDDFEPQLEHATSHKPNFLEEAMVELYFCTVLTTPHAVRYVPTPEAHLLEYPLALQVHTPGCDGYLGREPRETGAGPGRGEGHRWPGWRPD